VTIALHHVQLACPAGSEPALREFYGGLLGMTEVAKPPGRGDSERASQGRPTAETENGPNGGPRSGTSAEPSNSAQLAARGGVWFRAGTAELHLGVEEDFQPARKAHPGLIVSDLDTLARRLEQAGYPVTRDALLPGYHRIYTQDPNGNRIELLQPAAG
jgi:catechol 2,3-dioxygenase-like lactoylglutathione lyase family enzyme